MKTTLASLAAVILVAGSAFAEAPETMKKLGQALSTAAHQKKLAFVLMGRPTCSICNNTKEMIRDGKISVTAADFVMADVNVDDKMVYDEFMRKFHGQNFGNTLPFVAVTDSSGKLLASSGGYKNAEQWNALLAEARKKAGQ